MKLLRLALRAFLVLIGIVVLVLAALLVHGYGLLARPVGNPVPALAVAPDSAQLARGNHLCRVVCSSCHGLGADGRLAMSGSTENFLVIPGGPKFGTLYAPNITPGGVLGGVGDGQLSRAIREGVGFDDRPLLVMPSAHFHGMSDGDLAALISALRAQPSESRVTPRRALNPLGYLILGLHQYETSAQLPVSAPVPTPTEAPDSTYGAYLVPILGCADCHGTDYNGGRKGQFPPIGPDLVGLTRAMPITTFEAALRHGIKPAGGALDPARMPWTTFADLTDLEVRAVYAFLRRLPVR